MVSAGDSSAEASKDRLTGAFVGLAIGDTVGTTLEFKTRDSYHHISDMVGGGPFGLGVGEWTDDTSMALCLAESLKATGQADGSFDAADLMRRFINWWQFGYCSVTGGCFDIGMATKNALYRFEISGDPISGSTNEYSAGNGSIMRLAPVVLRYAGDKQAALKAAHLQGITTHASPECVEACALMTHVLLELAGGEPLLSALASAPGFDSVAIAGIKEGKFIEKSRDEIESSGYVVHTLEAALWAIHKSGSFEESVLLAANLGDDADTVAAVTGQFAGARWGFSGIPDAWIERLAWREKIESLAAELIRLSENESGAAV
jgi:ADP-ribosyl-[dinitrogen reductase] hydrolase